MSEARPPLDNLVSDTNKIAIDSLIDVMKEVQGFAEDVLEKLEQIKSATCGDSSNEE